MLLTTIPELFHWQRDLPKKKKKKRIVEVMEYLATFPRRAEMICDLFSPFAPETLPCLSGMRSLNWCAKRQQNQTIDGTEDLCFQNRIVVGSPKQCATTGVRPVELRHSRHICLLARGKRLCRRQAALPAALSVLYENGKSSLCNPSTGSVFHLRGGGERGGFFLPQPRASNE